MPLFWKRGVGRSYLITPSLDDQLNGNLFIGEQNISAISNLCVVTSNEKQMMDIPFLFMEGILLVVGS